MAEPTPDNEALRWGVGLFATAVIGAIGWLWQRVTAMEVRQDKAISDQVGALWSAINGDRKDASAFRERMLERLGELPTKAELGAMEARLIDRLDRHPRT